MLALLAAALACEVTNAATAWPIGSVLRMAFTAARAAGSARTAGLVSRLCDRSSPRAVVTSP